MSKYKPQDTIAEQGRPIFLQALNPHFFLPNDFGIKAGKDIYPDIDGIVRLRDGKGN